MRYEGEQKAQCDPQDGKDAVPIVEVNQQRGWTEYSSCKEIAKRYDFGTPGGK